MKKFSFVLVLAGIWAFAGCSAATDGPTTDDPSPESVEQAASSSSCHYKCNKCPPNQVCALYCTLQGKCESCQVLMLCIQGYHFDQNSCRCLPDQSGGGEACGNGHCGAGEFCCNESCGICAPEGGFCTDQYCAPAL